MTERPVSPGTTRFPGYGDARAGAVVLGVGNVLLTDEGVGVRVVEYIEKNYRLGPNVRCVDGGTGGLGLLGAVEGAGLLIIADAVRADRPPGAVIEFTPGDVGGKGPAKTLGSAHQVGLGELLAVMRFEGREPEAVEVVGVVPGSIEPGTDLTAEAEAGVPEAARLAAEILGRYGFSAKEVSDARKTGC